MLQEFEGDGEGSCCKLKEMEEEMEEEEKEGEEENEEKD